MFIKSFDKFFILFLFLILITNVAFSQTEVSGLISSNTTWKKEDSPILVVGNIKVASGAKLEIQAGVVVKINSSSVIQIDGELRAVGSQSDKIYFTSMEASPNRGDWKYIHFTDISVDAVVEGEQYKSGSLLQHCIFSYGGYLDQGNLFLEKATPYIINCEFRNSISHGIKILSAPNVKILNSIIMNNSKDGIYIPRYEYIQGSYYVNFFSLVNSEVSYNGGIGINFVEGVSDGRAAFRNNKIQYNRGGIYIRSVGGSGRATLEVIGCEIRENSSDYGAGIAMMRGHHTIIKNNLIINNKGNYGGGLYFGYGWDSYSHVIENNIFKGNTSIRGAAIYMNLKYQDTPSDVSISKNIISNNEGVVPSVISDPEGVGSILFLKDIDGYDGNTKVENNVFNGNTGLALVQFLNHKRGVFNFNTIEDNACTYLIKNSSAAGTADINARNNFWNGLLRSDIDRKIYDWLDDETLSSVIYDPILAKAIPIEMISANLASSNQICYGHNVEIEVSTNYYYTSDNLFILQLSDVYESFNNALNLDTLDAGQKIIRATLPDTLKVNSNYGLRVVSSVTGDISKHISIKVVSVTDKPIANNIWPGSIEYNTSAALAINDVAGANTYLWSVPEGFEIMSGQNSSSISVRAINGTASGDVVVKALNNCGEGNALTATIASTRATATIALSKLNQQYNGEPKPIVAITDPAGLTVAVQYDGSVTVPSDIGEYLVQAVTTDDNYTGEATATLVISAPTAVSDPEVAKFIKLYPNPTTGKSRLELNLGLTAQVIVTDITGRMIMETSATDSYEVDLEGLAAGLYFIQVLPNGKSPLTLKLLKR